MYYYSIALPVQTDLDDIVYTSERIICRGARIIVTFNRRTVTGICLKENAQEAITTDIAYKPVLEILDDSSILPPVLFELAAWLSRYYRCSIGKAIFAMLPSILLPEIASQARWIGTAVAESEYEILHELLSDNKFHLLKDIRSGL